MTKEPAVIEVADELAAETVFRKRVRRFLENNLGPNNSNLDILDVASSDETSAVTRAKQFQKAKYDAGLAGLTWPIEFGGAGLSNRCQTIYNDESSKYVTPDFIFTIGFGMCLPTVLAHGTDELKSRYVPAGLSGSEIWCQLFSEPSAGSDVAGLQTRAIRDGDEWIVSGQKVWTTQAHHCSYGIVLVRTNPDVSKHRGLSMFIVDMHSPGVTVRPLKQMNGGSNFNEVFFDDVRIPADQILGEPGDGWRVALTTLMNERVAIGTGRSGEDTDPLAHVKFHLDLAKQRGLRQDPLVRQEIVDLFIRYRIMDVLGLRIRATVTSGGIPGPEGSVAKLSGSLLARRSSDVAARLAGPTAIAWSDKGSLGERASQMVLTSPAGGIAGGTNEVMKNILGERVLGLPREPSVDRDMPFNQIPKG